MYRVKETKRVEQGELEEHLKVFWAGVYGVEKADISITWKYWNWSWSRCGCCSSGDRDLDGYEVKVYEVVPAPVRVKKSTTKKGIKNAKKKVVKSRSNRTVAAKGKRTNK